MQEITASVKIPVSSSTPEWKRCLNRAVNLYCIYKSPLSKKKIVLLVLNFGSKFNDCGKECFKKNILNPNMLEENMRVNVEDLE